MDNSVNYYISLILLVPISLDDCFFDEARIPNYANISNLKAFLPSKNIGDWGSAYASIFHRFPVMRYIFNSVFYAASVTIGSIVVNALAWIWFCKI